MRAGESEAEGGGIRIWGRGARTLRRWLIRLLGLRAVAQDVVEQLVHPKLETKLERWG